MSTQNGPTIESLTIDLDGHKYALAKAAKRFADGEVKTDSYVKRMQKKVDETQAALDALKLDAVQSPAESSTDPDPDSTQTEDGTIEPDEREYHVYAIEKLKGDGKTWKPVGERVSHSANGALRRYGIRNGRKGIGKSRSGRRFRALNTGVEATDPKLETATA